MPRPGRPLAKGHHMPEPANRRGSCLNPVILPVPPHVHSLAGRPRVAILSRLARVAVRISARLSAVAPMRCPKDDQGVPRPYQGIYWSVAHKPEWVAGVVATVPVGIDIEKVRPRPDSLYRRIAAADEWRLGAGRPKMDWFYRIWTAKEAVLKAEGLGLRGLSRCRLTAVGDQDRLRLQFEERSWTVVHCELARHIAALTLVTDRIAWQINPRWF